MHRTILKDAEAIEAPAPSNDHELNVYPNPSVSAFNFRLKTTSQELVTIRIFDLMGRLVREYSSMAPDEIIKVGDNLDAGIFVAVVTQGTYRKTVKISRIN